MWHTEALIEARFWCSGSLQEYLILISSLPRQYRYSTHMARKYSEALLVENCAMMSSCANTKSKMPLASLTTPANLVMSSLWVCSTFSSCAFVMCWRGSTLWFSDKSAVRQLNSDATVAVMERPTLAMIIDHLPTCSLVVVAVAKIRCRLLTAALGPTAESRRLLACVTMVWRSVPTLSLLDACVSLMIVIMMGHDGPMLISIHLQCHESSSPQKDLRSIGIILALYAFMSDFCEQIQGGNT